MVHIRPAVVADALSIAPNLREADAREIRQSSGLAPANVLTLSIDRDALAAESDGEIVALFGCRSLGSLTREGRPWMVGTAWVEQNRATVGRYTARHVAAWKNQYERLSNHVSVDNEMSIRWLDWLGFRFRDPAPYGPFRAMFMKFEWERGADV